MPKNLKFKCWSCAKTYKAPIEITFEQNVSVRCPFCNSEAVVDLSPYRDKRTVVMRGDTETELMSDNELGLPDIIPTDPPQ